MQVTLADVISLNGKITQGDNPDIHAWSSEEDWEHFVQLRDQSDVVIIDRKTYETVRPKPEPGKLRIVFTSTPEKFEDDHVPGVLEFTNVSPTVLMQRLVTGGYQKVLLAGGGRLCSDFFEADLVDDVYMSFEPVLFGEGVPMLREAPLTVSLLLESVRQLNTQGTLLAHYTVLKAN
jgi:dihydrofolate reductase